MKRRMLDGGIWANEKFAELPCMARLLQIGLINLADDQGRMKGHPVYLRSQLFPYDDVSADDIRSWLEVISTNGTIILYQVDSKDYIQLVNWWDYQSLQYAQPSEHPRPDGWLDQIRYNAKGNITLTSNWKKIDGTPLDDTCDQDGNPLPIVATFPPRNPGGRPRKNPGGNPGGFSGGNPGEKVTKDQIKNKTTKDQDHDQHQEGAGAPDDDDDKKKQERKAVIKAWHENMPGTMTQILGEKLNDLVDECGAASVIHGITVGVESGARNFKYVAAVARNHASGKEYTPPSPQTQRNGNHAPTKGRNSIVAEEFAREFGHIVIRSNSSMEVPNE